MPREAELLDPVSVWIHDQYGAQRTLLTYAEPQGRGGRRPDLLAVFANYHEESVDSTTVVPVEIERSSKGALHDSRNGLSQLRKYPGHAKYLALPRTVANRWEARDVPKRCRVQGVGYLVVDLPGGEVSCEVEPVWTQPSHGLRYYPKAMERWIALRKSGDTYRRVEGGRIVDSA
jgi:hypothetical protein